MFRGAGRPNASAALPPHAIQEPLHGMHRGAPCKTIASQSLVPCTASTTSAKRWKEQTPHNVCHAQASWQRRSGRLRPAHGRWTRVRRKICHVHIEPLRNACNRRSFPIANAHRRAGGDVAASAIGKADRDALCASRVICGALADRREIRFVDRGRKPATRRALQQMICRNAWRAARLQRRTNDSREIEDPTPRQGSLLTKRRNRKPEPHAAPLRRGTESNAARGRVHKFIHHQ